MLVKVNPCIYLQTATTGLEFRQKEKYSEKSEYQYQKCIKKSLVGFKMAPKQESSRTSGSSSFGGGEGNNKEDEAYIVSISRGQ